jgi:O-acetyl-ADP-ribose deacetylase (regulator of RNase III)
MPRAARGASPRRLPTGQAVATTAGELPARWVIHTVGPVYSRRQDRSAQLASCYTESLRVADELGARVVAFPAGSAVEEVRFVLYGQEMHGIFAAALSG